MQVAISILKFSLALWPYTYQLAAILEICKLEGQNEVKRYCLISKIKKGISEFICAKFHDFFTKCTRGSIYKNYSIDYEDFLEFDAGCGYDDLHVWDMCFFKFKVKYK